MYGCTNWRFRRRWFARLLFWLAMSPIILRPLKLILVATERSSTFTLRFWFHISFWLLEVCHLFCWHGFMDSRISFKNTEQWLNGCFRFGCMSRWLARFAIYCCVLIMDDLRQARSPSGSSLNDCHNGHEEIIIFFQWISLRKSQSQFWPSVSRSGGCRNLRARVRLAKTDCTTTERRSLCLLYTSDAADE